MAGEDSLIRAKVGLPEGEAFPILLVSVGDGFLGGAEKT